MTNKSTAPQTDPKESWHPVVSILSFIGFGLAWLIIPFAGFIFYVLGGFNTILIFIGKAGAIIAAIIGLLILLSPALLRIFTKKTWVIALSSLCLTVFLIIGFILINVGANNYVSTFSTKTWLTHPQARQYMLADLENNYVLIGKTESEIVDLLGMPDEGIRNERYTYYCGIHFMDSYFFEVTFSQDPRISIHPVVIKIDTFGFE